MTLHKSFPSISAPNARVLILGTLPGAASLAKREYYAKPQNAFWRIMSELFEFPRDLEYEERLARLKDKGIALWDVCATAERSGSLDTAIKDAVANDFADFYRKHPGIELIAFNGAKAADLYGRLVLNSLSPALQAIQTVTLPSTSPAHASMTFAAKLKSWRGIRR